MVLLLCCVAVQAQEVTLKEIKERESEAQQAMIDSEKIPVDKSFKGHTPLSSLLALAKAIRAENFDSAIEFFDFRYTPATMTIAQKKELVKQLDIVWSQHHSLDISILSDAPEGHLNDGLPSHRDLLGVIKTSKADIPIYLQRVPDGKGGKEWKISSHTVNQIPILWQEFGYHPLAISLGEYLPHFTIFAMHNWQFVGFIISLILAWYITALIRTLLIKVVSYSDTYSRTMRRFIRVPLRFFLFFIILQWSTGHLGLSLNARAWLETGTLSYLAAIFLTLGIIEFIFAMYASRVAQEKNAIAIIKPLVTTLKIVVVIVYGLNWFADAGFNITAIITGLGIGSLAVALAAQKSLENVFGAFTLYLARPIKPGDMCKFGNTQGRVEEIGLRSTKIRKLDRKVVYVPNSVIASMELENIAEIDNRRYQKRLRVRLNTEISRLKALTDAIRELIDNHPNTIDLERYVRFEDIDEDAFVIVINCYLTVSGRVAYKELEEKINYQVMDVVDQHDIELAIPEYNVSMNTVKT